MIWWLPLESIDRRYTAHLRAFLSEVFEYQELEYYRVHGHRKIVDGSLGSSQFLNPTGTIVFKSTQMSEVARRFQEGKVKDGDVFFLEDIWYPGLTAIRYMASMLGIRVRVCGLLHAGSHTPTDDVSTKLGTGRWVRAQELSWLLQCDMVFCTSHHQLAELESVHGPLRNVIVTGAPFLAPIRPETPFEERELRVVFPHRKHWEKQLDLFLAVMGLVCEKEPVKYYVTHESPLPKEEYYRLLSSSRVVFSAALQENFGYAMLEAVACGCNVLVPDRLSYRELFPPDVRYPNNASVEQLARMVLHALKCPQGLDTREILRWASEAAGRIGMHINTLAKECTL